MNSEANGRAAGQEGAKCQRAIDKLWPIMKDNPLIVLESGPPNSGGGFVGAVPPTPEEIEAELAEEEDAEDDQEEEQQP